VLQYAVKIDHVWEQADGGKVLRYAVPSLGTRVGPGAVLTHNHYHPAPEAAWAEALIVTAAGYAASAASLDELDIETVNAETTRFALAGAPALPAAPIASTHTLAGLQAGDLITVVYRDDDAGALAQRDFAIAAVGAGVLTLADPGHVINGGDSGGGAFYRGELVGNTWGFLTDDQRQPVGLFNVALLSAN
jgi:hypothetical protein